MTYIKYDMFQETIRSRNYNVQIKGDLLGTVRVDEYWWCHPVKKFASFILNPHSSVVDIPRGLLEDLVVFMKQKEAE